MESNGDHSEMDSHHESKSPTSIESEKSSKIRSVITMEGNSTNSPLPDDGDKFFKRPARPTAPRDFRTTLQYNDLEDHLNQRAHSVGIGLFNTDEIEDLPPRHREKVRTVYKKIVEFANAVIPPGSVETSHGGPIQMTDLLSLGIPQRSRNNSEAGRNFDRSRTGSFRSGSRGEGRKFPESAGRQSFEKKRSLSSETLPDSDGFGTKSAKSDLCRRGSSESLNSTNHQRPRENARGGHSSGYASKKPTKRFPPKIINQNCFNDYSPSKSELKTFTSTESLNSTTSRGGNQRSRKNSEGCSSSEYASRKSMKHFNSEIMNQSCVASTSSKSNLCDKPKTSHVPKNKSDNQSKDFCDKASSKKNEYKDSRKDSCSSSNSYGNNCRKTESVISKNENHKERFKSNGKRDFDKRNSQEPLNFNEDAESNHSMKRNVQQKKAHNIKDSHIAKNERRSEFKGCNEDPRERTKGGFPNKNVHKENNFPSRVIHNKKFADAETDESKDCKNSCKEEEETSQAFISSNNRSNLPSRDNCSRSQEKNSFESLNSSCSKKPENQHFELEEKQSIKQNQRKHLSNKNKIEKSSGFSLEDHKQPFKRDDHCKIRSQSSSSTVSESEKTNFKHRDDNKGIQSNFPRTDPYESRFSEKSFENRNKSKQKMKFKNEPDNVGTSGKKNECTSNQNKSECNFEFKSSQQVMSQRKIKNNRWEESREMFSEDIESNKFSKGKNASLESLSSRASEYSAQDLENNRSLSRNPNGHRNNSSGSVQKFHKRSPSNTSMHDQKNSESNTIQDAKCQNKNSSNFKHRSRVNEIAHNSEYQNRNFQKNHTVLSDCEKFSENNDKSKSSQKRNSTYKEISEKKNTLNTNESKEGLKKGLLSSDLAALNHVMSVVEFEQKEIKHERLDPEKEIKRWEDRGFFVNVNVSENSSSLEFWRKFFQDALNTSDFSLDYCCKFTESLILNFERKEAALNAVTHLKRIKRKTKDLREPHLVCVAKLKTRLIRPCNCEKTIVSGCLEYFEDFCRKYSLEHEEKIKDIKNEIKRISKHRNSVEHVRTHKETLYTLESMMHVFLNQCQILKEEVESSKLKSSSIQEIRLLKKRFSQECNSFQRGLPIYSEKLNILEAVRFHPVSVVVADTGSGKSTQLAEYLLGPRYENGTIICTQPRKIAAISITNYVCGQLGCAVGKLVGYDVGLEKKCEEDTKIIYMTDYALLKKILRNRRLKGVSHVIIDEAHERTLYTDLLLGLLKECVDAVPSLRVIITSATIDPEVFVRFFNLSQKALIKVPGRTYPVKEVWLEKPVESGWNYVEACVKTAVKINSQESHGDILVFLTSPSEIDESVIMFKELCRDNHTPTLLSLHGKTDLQEQLLIFDTKSPERKVIFATNAAETSLTIPGIKYVIDSGMAKELIYYPDKNKSSLVVTFINKSSAEQRKGRAGRTQPGVCYRMYSKTNFSEMPDRSTPEILKTNLAKALLKIYEFGIEPERFQFIETPSKESIARSLESLEDLGLLKNGELTKMGKQVVKLPIDPRLSKLVLLGVKAEIGFEMTVIAALVSEAGRLFLRFEDNKVEADAKKLEFCHKKGDLCTFLEVYKQWMEVRRHERYQWCVRNHINSRALNSAAKTINEILICLQQDLKVNVNRKYNNAAFDSFFEAIVFTCFSENLCIYSGHPKLGYSSPNFKESLYLHPSSALKYLKKDLPEFLVYGTLMLTTRNFLMDVTPIKRGTLEQAYQRGTFKFPVDMLKSFQIAPKTLGPFGESVLVKHIIGKGGSKIQNLELLVEKLTRSRNFKIDVCVEKGIIVIYVDTRYHDAVSKLIYDMVDGIYSKFAKEEEIVKMSPFSYFCIGAAGKISEILMPGEFREIIVENVHRPKVKQIEETLRKHGNLLSFQLTESKSFCRINATFSKVLDAQSAMRELARQGSFSVKSHVYVEESVKSPLYRLRVSWCRSLSTGSGFIEFESEAEKVIASGRLTRNSICIKNHTICFKPSNISDKELEITNLPAVVDEGLIQDEIIGFLEGVVEVKNIHISRKKSPQVSEKDIAEVKKQLNAQLSPFVPSNKLVIDVTYPEPRSNIWSAMVLFENQRDLEDALSKLENNIIINSFPAEIKEVAESHLPYKKDIYEALHSHIIKEFRKIKGSKFTVETLPDDTMVNLKFSCRTVRDLEVLRRGLVKLLMGRTIECFGQKKFSILFTLSGERFISAISSETDTFITLDSFKKTVHIYGLAENCRRAEELICSRISSQKLNSSGKKTFNLKNSSLPAGFIKSLCEKYGLDLRKLVKEYKLEDAVLNFQKGTLTFYGNKKQLKSIEECLEKICLSLFESEKTSKAGSDQDACAICFSDLPFDYFRLENCGHAFCKSCLLLQVKSSPVPVVCVQENCGKDIFLVDIKRILALGDDHMKKSFHNAALQYFVNANIGKITYCPSPGCSMVCRVLENSPEFLCPECGADICTKCQTLCHYGMSCEMFKNFVDDEDYSLKVWMQENSSQVKRCPNCMVVIEKESGCNHMECFNCRSHFCWLCLEAFPEGKLVYDHLPYCPKNQGTED